MGTSVNINNGKNNGIIGNENSGNTIDGLNKGTIPPKPNDKKQDWTKTGVIVAIIGVIVAIIVGWENICNFIY